MTSNPEVKILADANAIAQTAAAEFLQAAQKAVREKNSFSVALAGGSTPKALYGLLASNPLLQAKVPWAKIQFFFGDERHVPPDHAESNFRMASEAMFSKAPVQPQQVHRMQVVLRSHYADASGFEQRGAGHVSGAWCGESARPQSGARRTIRTRPASGTNYSSGQWQRLVARGSDSGEHACAASEACGLGEANGNRCAYDD
jgi:Glucosamine-6-phosphate isomerases/6-phosphogluconolactonase